MKLYYWINSGKYYESPDGHIEKIINEPYIFGLTKEYLEKKYKKSGERYGSFGNASKDIMNGLIKKGWMRLKYYIKGKYWLLDYDTYKNRKNDIIEFIKWSTGSNLLQFNSKLKLRGIFENINTPSRQRSSINTYLEEENLIQINKKLYKTYLESDKIRETFLHIPFEKADILRDNFNKILDENKKQFRINYRSIYMMIASINTKPFAIVKANEGKKPYIYANFFIESEEVIKNTRKKLSYFLVKAYNHHTDTTEIYRFLIKNPEITIEEFTRCFGIINEIGVDTYLLCIPGTKEKESTQKKAEIESGIYRITDVKNEVIINGKIAEERGEKLKNLVTLSNINEELDREIYNLHKPDSIFMHYGFAAHNIKYY